MFHAAEFSTHIIPPPPEKAIDGCLCFGTRVAALILSAFQINVNI